VPGVAVIGGGVIGLAVARAFALAGREVFVLEAERELGAHSSSRNSEVIHAGLYYPPGSLKAELCVRGKTLLYDYCAAHEIPHARLGKLVVAASYEELPELDRILNNAERSGVSDLDRLDASEVTELEPSLRAAGGLFSSSTGIIDAHAFMAALRRDATGAGAVIRTSARVVTGRAAGGAIALRTSDAADGETLFDVVVNAAGCAAQRVASRIEGVLESSVPASHYAKGHYFTLRGASPFRHLVYPVPEPGGLGVHVTLDLAGTARFGPDVTWVDGVDYGFDEGRAIAFYAAIRRYFPGLADGALSPGYTGIRPKLGPSGSAPHDFVIHGPAEHGVPGLVNLYGIESPGLTASLAIAERVQALLG
jgi:L-2-hydroxyglutarate oxidase LhgO